MREKIKQYFGEYVFMKPFTTICFLKNLMLNSKTLNTHNSYNINKRLYYRKRKPNPVKHIKYK